MQFFVFWTIIVYVLYVINLSMKTIILQLWQWVLKHRKKIIYGALVLFALQICFFDIWWIWIQNVAHAAETASQSESFENIVSWKVNLLSFVKTVLYILVYPLMFLAGKLADNSFVYGEVFWFDAVLWNLRNFMRNLANFWLWFIFVYKIFEYLLKWQKSWDMKKILVSSLIAWIWIQASWFLMMALIDVSTLLTYWIWWLPISVLWDDISKNTWWDAQKGWWFNPYALKTLLSVDVGNVPDLNVYMTNISGGTSGNYISECRTFSYKKGDVDETLILAPKMIYYQDNNNEFHATMDNVCHLYGQVYWFKSLVPEIKEKRTVSVSDAQWWADAQKEYYSAGTSYISQITTSSESITWDIAWCSVLEVWDAHVKDGVWATQNFNIILTWEKCWLDVDNKRIWSGSTIQMKDLISNNGTFVWVFTALYSSLLNAGSSIIQNTDSGVYEKFLGILLTLGHIIAIAIPLIAVVLVLVMRIWIIWIAITLSPIIILLSAFGLFDKLTKSVKLLEYLDLKNLIWIIFSPVVICFAVSMSTVLVKVIEKINTSKINTEPLILWWLVQVNLAWFTVWLWQLIIAVMWIAITWFLLWAAIRSSKLWEKWGIIDSLYNLANTAIWSVPIIPIPWKDAQWNQNKIWFNTAFGLNGQQGLISSIDRNLKNTFNNEDQKILEQWLDPKKAAEEAQQKRNDNRYQGYSSWLLNLPVTESLENWDSKTITVWDEDITFASLVEWDKKKVISQINSITDINRKDAFGDGKWSLDVWWETYKYDKEAHEYKIETPSQT